MSKIYISYPDPYPKDKFFLKLYKHLEALSILGDEDYHNYNSYDYPKDYYSLQFKYELFKDIHIEGLGLNFLNFTDCVFINCTFNDVSFDFSKLENCSFNQCSFSQNSFHGSVIIRCNFFETSFDKIFFFPKLLVENQFDRIIEKERWAERSTSKIILKDKVLFLIKKNNLSTKTICPKDYGKDSKFVGQPEICSNSCANCILAARIENKDKNKPKYTAETTIIENNVYIGCKYFHQNNRQDLIRRMKWSK
jgi:hypothetical protein